MTIYRGIVFDKDGTLLDFDESWLQSYLEVCEMLAQRAERPELAGQLMRKGGYIAETRSWVSDSLLASGSNQQIFDFWSSELGITIDGSLLAEIRRIFASAAARPVAAVSNLKPLLESFQHRGIKLGVATMDDYQSAVDMLEQFQVAELFDFVCGADCGYGVKPEPGMVEAFCNHCQVDPEAVIMVGDSPRDINMGRAAGAGLTVGVLSGAHGRSELEKYADHVIDDISQIPALL